MLGHCGARQKRSARLEPWVGCGVGKGRMAWPAGSGRGAWTDLSKEVEMGPNLERTGDWTLTRY